MNISLWEKPMQIIFIYITFHFHFCINFIDTLFNLSCIHRSWNIATETHWLIKQMLPLQVVFSLCFLYFRQHSVYSESFPAIKVGFWNCTDFHYVVQFCCIKKFFQKTTILQEPSLGHFSPKIILNLWGASQQFLLF